ncbi:MAG: ATP-dependent endonuclease [Flavobacteriales bacterium]|nr:ATP-dependent endonuclease [Flavobacteriales bacterium]
MQSLKDIFPFEPTSIQEKAMHRLSRFTFYSEKSALFILKGYAGTGKTTLISTYINWLPKIGLKSVLSAPTGRAAKVLSGYSNKLALTLHKQIYFHAYVDGKILFTIQKNKCTDTIFIVDEASMISDSGGMGGSFVSKKRTLLDDLIDYVYSGKNCRLILIGDTAQLPPVGSSESPALNVDYLSARFPIQVGEIELNQVTRQSEESGILHNATLLRNVLQRNDSFPPKFNLNGFADVKRLNGYDIEEEISYCYSKDGIENTIVVCRSNKQANNFNKYIKYNVLFQEDELNAGEMLMVVRNNYYWLKMEEDLEFIANGDMIELMRLIDYEDKFGYRFANASIRLLDSKKNIEFDVKIILNTLTSESSSLSIGDNQKLYEAIWGSYSEIKDKTKRQKAVKENPYYNALQVKFGYAITCHKSQGGQWKNVFVDQGYLTDEMINKEYLRWLYTGITRAVNKLYLTNFNEKFFF